MDKINFNNQDNFPFGITTANFMQNMIEAVAKLTALGGSNYILSGCEENEGIITNGLIVINGEMLPFETGAIQTNIEIVETRTNVDAFGKTFNDAYVTRKVMFSDTGTLPWANIKRIFSNQELSARIDEIKGDPPGIRVSWCGLLDRIPDNYMLCDGRTLNILDYPELYQNIGTNFGAVGTTQFKLPDMRSKFVVGYNDVDGDYNSIGRKGGKKEVVLTKDQLAKHDHLTDSIFNKMSARAGDIASTGTITSQDGGSPTSEYRVASMTDQLWGKATLKEEGNNEAHENRPPYFVEAFIIKVKY